MAMDGNEDLDMDSRWTKRRTVAREANVQRPERRHDCRDASVLDAGPCHDRGDDYRLQSKPTEISLRTSGQKKEPSK